MRCGKVWGQTELLWRTPMVELHRFSVMPNARCSLHKHDFKWNGFAVVSGRLFIEVQKNDYALTDVTELGPGDFTAVKPGEFHRFFTKNEPVEAFEIYSPEPLSEDIVRKDVGGVAQPVCEGEVTGVKTVWTQCT